MMKARNSVLNIVIIGPQGSGKGTQAALIAERRQLKHIETGKLLRQMAKSDTPLGRRLDILINKKGRLVPSSFVTKVIKAELKKVGKDQGVIFDGYPRNITQAKFLSKVFKEIGRHITHVFYMPISQKTTIKRLATRRTCDKCGRVFISGKTVKRGASKCPICGGRLIQRDDDKPTAIKKRLDIFNKQTKPLIQYYKKQGVLIRINGEPPIKQVAKEIFKHL